MDAAIFFISFQPFSLFFFCFMAALKRNETTRTMSFKNIHKTIRHYLTADANVTSSFSIRFHRLLKQYPVVALG